MLEIKVLLKELPGASVQLKLTLQRLGRIVGGNEDNINAVMRNLKIAHLRARENFDAISCIDVMLAWNPAQPREVRDRGLLYAQMKVWGLAIRDFEAYLEECPAARDRLRIELELANARKERLDVN